MKKFIVPILFLLITATGASGFEIVSPALEKTAAFEGGTLYRTAMPYGDVPVIRLRGTHYEMGRQYGALLGAQIIESTIQLGGLAVDLTGVDPSLLRPFTLTLWQRMAPFVPAIFKDEFRGIIDGAKEAGVKIELVDLVAPIVVANISDMNNIDALFGEFGLLPARKAQYSCSSFAAWGPRTEGGRLFSTRVLDWNARTGADKFRVITVFEPVDENGNEMQAYATAGYVGLLGALDGMNENGITVSEIGSENKIEKLEGMPWTLMFRQVLENARSLDEAVAIIKEAENTIGYNFVIGDGDADRYGTPGWTPGAAAVEENGAHTAVVYADDPLEHNAVWIDNTGATVLRDGATVPYGTPLSNAVLRADVAASPDIRRTQTADNGPGDPENDGNPLIGGSYLMRHVSQYNALRALETGGAFFNPYTGAPVLQTTGSPAQVNVDNAMIVAANAGVPDSCILMVVYAATDLEMYVSWEKLDGGNWTAAFDMPFLKLNLKELLNK